MIVQVLVNTSVTKLNKVFDYVVPIELEQHILPYKRVVIPFGKGDRTTIGLILNVISDSKYDKDKLKYISSVEDKKPLINDFKIKLANWMSKRYLANNFECINMFLPPKVGNKGINENNEKNITIYKINAFDINNLKRLTEKKKVILDRLVLNIGKSYTLKELKDLFEITTIRWYVENNILEQSLERIYRDPFKNYTIENSVEHKLNEEQNNIYTNVSKMLDSRKYSEVLIHGITGSGKTEVYIRLIQKCLDNDRNVILLVPEISLTPQITNRIISRFGSIVAILHSKLSDGERYDEWDKIQKGLAKIVIGARSAIFAPIENVGLVVIDEEHDNSYKSEGHIKYDAIEVAQKLCINDNAVLIYGSATPSIKTYYRAEQFEIEHFEMNNRVNNAELPSVKLIEIKDNLVNNESAFTVELYNKINEVLTKKEQIMLFINKRGYFSSIICNKCGHNFKCPNCDVSLNYHHDKKILLCHYCNHAEVPTGSCPNCGGKTFDKNVMGIQKVEDEIKKLFPSASYIRMDKDTTSKKDGHMEILEKFKNDKIDILIGTQMITKGHDFSNVTLVGVLSADRLLYTQQYNSNEIAFNTLSQLAGRAGRKNLIGEVLIQTYDINNEILKYVVNHDYISMYKNEIEFRKTLNYPPFCDIISIVISCKDDQHLAKITQHIYEVLKSYAFDKYIVYEPVQANIPKLNGKVRLKIVIKCKYTQEISNILKNINGKYTDHKISIDIGINSNEE